MAIFFPLTVFSTAVLSLKLKKKVSTVIIQNAVVALNNSFRMFVNLTLDKVILISKDTKCSVNVIKLKLGYFQQFICLIQRGQF